MSVPGVLVAPLDVDRRQAGPQFADGLQKLPNEVLYSAFTAKHFKATSDMAARAKLLKIKLDDGLPDHTVLEAILDSASRLQRIQGDAVTPGAAAMASSYAQKASPHVPKGLKSGIKRFPCWEGILGARILAIRENDATTRLDHQGRVVELRRAQEQLISMEGRNINHRLRNSQSHIGALALCLCPSLCSSEPLEWTFSDVAQVRF